MPKAKITTIKLTKNTKSRLDKLRVHKRDSYDEILQRMLNILNTCRLEPNRAQAKLRNIERQIRMNKTEEKRRD